MRQLYGSYLPIYGPSKKYAQGAPTHHFQHRRQDIDTADEIPSCSKGTLVDVKTLSPGDVYPDDRAGESNAAVNARQVRVNQDYHKKAKDLDTRLGGDQQDGFDAELNTFGRTRTNTNPNDTEANAAGRSGNARALRKQNKCGVHHEGEGHWPKFSQKL